MEKEELKRKFVGSKYDKFEKANFSLPALLFGGLYFAYRKMLLAGIIFYLFTTAIMTIFSTRINIILLVISYLLLYVSMSLLFNSMYRTFYNKKVDKILSSSENGLDKAVVDKCKKQGGTSIPYIFLVIALGICLSLTVNFILSNKNKEKNVSDNISNSENESISDNSNTTYYEYVDDNDENTNSNEAVVDSSNNIDNTLENSNTIVEDNSTEDTDKDDDTTNSIMYDTNIEINNFLDIKIPNIFIEKGTTGIFNGKSNYDYSLNNDGKSYSFKLQALKNFTADGYYNMFVNKTNPNFKIDNLIIIEPININNINWKGFESEFFGIERQLVTEINGKTFLFTYTTPEEKVEDDIYYNQIINSIKIKEQ